MTTAARTLPRRRFPRIGARRIAALAAVALIAFGGWTWLRSSSLVAVRQIRISGVFGPDAARIRASLRRAAGRMTTLNVALGALHSAVAPYAVVKRLQVSTSFPHEMTIAVSEQVPVAEITAGGRTVAVSGDGTLLRTPGASEPLPALSLAVAPGGDRVTGIVLQETRLLAAAPYALLARVAGVTSDATHGFIAQIRSGPKIIFGPAGALRAKWAAAAAVLADPTSGGADYIDVTDPVRPAAGAGPDSAAAATSSSGAVTSPSGAAPTGTTPALPGVPATAPGGASPAGAGVTGAAPGTTGAAPGATGAAPGATGTG